MSIPEKTTVLVVGGGPGGSYAATVLAREGIDTVLLEADKFPRYHIGESMLLSLRHFLRFVELDSVFDSYGFIQKYGAAFRLNSTKKDGFTDFREANEISHYSWNVVRSEADNLMFQHAGKSGAKIFDGVRVKSINFVDVPQDGSTPGRPVSASYVRKDDNTSGEIKFDYIVDASGRAGLLSTKYLKNRRYNQSLRNVANWGYWQNAGAYGVSTPKENSPLFEALKGMRPDADESGWAWLIPLHNGTTSVGVVMNQKMSTDRKAKLGSPGAKEFYRDNLEHLAPGIWELLGEGELTSDIKSASDYSYSASGYAIPYGRIVGDAGCFIDPFFSSGVHLALVGGLAAATTIATAIKGGCAEEVAADWHSKKISASYTRFLFVVLSAYRQMCNQEKPVLSDFEEDNFDHAFSIFRTVIQGSADTKSKLSQEDLEKTLEFCTSAFYPSKPEERDAVLEKLNHDSTNLEAEVDLSPYEQKVVNHIRAKRMMRTEDKYDMSGFESDVINGLIPNLEKGNLKLVKSEA